MESGVDCVVCSPGALYGGNLAHFPELHDVIFHDYVVVFTVIASISSPNVHSPLHHH